MGFEQTFFQKVLRLYQRDAILLATYLRIPQELSVAVQGS